MTRLYTARMVYSLCYTDICIENGERIPSRFYVVDGEEKVCIVWQFGTCNREGIPEVLKL